MNRPLALLTAGIALLSACTPMETTHGNIVEDYRMAEVTPGVSTRTNVLKSLGSPTTTAPFDDNVWYYIGQEVEQRGVFDPEVTDQKIVVVAFNQDGVVSTIDKIDADQINVPIDRDKTHTGGNDVTFLQQLLGNVGKFNRPQESESR